MDDSLVQITATNSPNKAEAGCTIDVIDAYQNVNTCIENIQLMKENVDQEPTFIFKQALRMADQLKVEPNIPRVAKK